MMRRGLPAEVDLEKDPYSLYEGVEYQQFWTGSQRRSLDELEHAVVRHLLPLSGCRIIDVGCGFGRLADCYMDRFNQVIMVDGSMSLLQQALERTKGQAIYIACDATHLPFRTGSFDSVLMIRVFHHIQNPQACISELHRVSCIDGCLIFSYLNKQNLLRIVRWMMGANREKPFDARPAGLGSTFVSHHPKAVHEMLYEAGFSNIHDYGTGILDRLAGRIGTADQWVTLGEHLAPFLGWSRIAPWIICSAQAGGTASLVDTRGVGALLQCPACGGSLSDEKDGYLCLMCRNRYPIVNGIIDLRVR